MVLLAVKVKVLLIILLNVHVGEHEGRVGRQVVAAWGVGHGMHGRALRAIVEDEVGGADADSWRVLE